MDAAAWRRARNGQAGMDPIVLSGKYFRGDMRAEVSLCAV